MDFPFPEIARACPVCSGPCGAIYRGYYRRGMICPAALFIGFVAVRTGFCKATSRRFALFPEFLIPFRSFTRTAFAWLWRAWRESSSELGATVDRWFDQLDRETSLSISTLDSQLRFILLQLRVGSQAFGLPAFAPLAGGVSGMTELTVDCGLQAVNHLAFGAVANSRIDPPP